MINFKYNLPSSRRREEYLVSYLENLAVADLINTQAQLTAHLMPMSSKQNNVIRQTFDMHKAYSEIILPSSKKIAKIEDMTKSEISSVKDNLKQLREALLSKK